MDIYGREDPIYLNQFEYLISFFLFEKARMLIRLKEDKELDKIIFNSKEEKLLNPSKDELATEIKTNVKTSVFGIKS